MIDARQQILSLDNGWLILTEYTKNVNANGQPGVGDAFLLWLLQNWANPARCETVTITPLGHGNFSEFPADPALSGFDLSDRKFVAVIEIITTFAAIRYAACLESGDPRDGGIAPDTFLNTARRPDGSPLDPTFLQDFLSLQNTDDWPN